jgi:hypothetical protein
MSYTTSPKQTSLIARRAREIRGHWSPQERQQRAEEGRRLRREFVRRIVEAPCEPEIWAVGAIGDEDMQRIAG